jgi:co-chaperonin GroES (HSP10)
MHDWLLIELEPAEKKRGSIIVPDPSRQPIRIGKVLRAGPGRRFPKSKAFRPVVVEKGERVAFWMATTQCGGADQITYHLPENQRMIRETDVLMVVGEGVEVST